MNKEYNDLCAAVNCKLEQYFAGYGDRPYQPLYDAMAYATLGGGKRLRGVLCLALGKRFGLPVEQMLPFACALEMIHASTLVHDDLPCMDNDDFRRGKPSCHKQFGEDTALLAGDALYAFALSVVCAHADRSVFTEGQILDAVAAMIGGSGADGVLGGQVLDKRFETETGTLDDLLLLHALKTGALFSVIAKLVCILARPEPERQRALALYMKHLGLAFQIKDDLLDLEGSFETLGKATGADAQKTTFISVLGAEGAEAYLAKEIGAARENALKLPECAFLEWICDFVMNRDC